MNNQEKVEADLSRSNVPGEIDLYNLFGAPWIGVDLDGTLAKYDGWVGPEEIGCPIPWMVRKVTQQLEYGKKVKIFTARVHPQNPDLDLVKEAIGTWVKQVFGRDLEITCMKDPMMVELWDDRCKEVVLNTGLFTQEPVPVHNVDEYYKEDEPEPDTCCGGDECNCSTEKITSEFEINRLTGNMSALQLINGKLVKDIETLEAIIKTDSQVIEQLQDRNHNQGATIDKMRGKLKEAYAKLGQDVPIPGYQACELNGQILVSDNVKPILTPAGQAILDKYQEDLKKVTGAQDLEHGIPASFKDEEPVYTVAEGTARCQAILDNPSVLNGQQSGEHYKNYPVQPAVYCQLNKIPSCESQAIYYLTRHKEKGQADDLVKAIHHTMIAAELEYPILFAAFLQDIQDLLPGMDEKTVPDLYATHHSV